MPESHHSKRQLLNSLGTSSFGEHRQNSDTSAEHKFNCKLVATNECINNNKSTGRNRRTVITKKTFTLKTH